MKFLKNFFFLTILLEINTFYINRRRDGDRFEGFICDGITSKTYNKGCQCESQFPTFKNITNAQCVSDAVLKTEVSTCKSGYLQITEGTLQNKANFVIDTACMIDAIDRIDIWDYNEVRKTFRWSVKNRTKMLNKVARGEAKHQISLDFTNGNWKSLLARIVLTCVRFNSVWNISGSDCVLIKIHGNRSYPLPASDILNPIMTTSIKTTPTTTTPTTTTPKMTTPITTTTITTIPITKSTSTIRPEDTSTKVPPRKSGSSTAVIVGIIFAIIAIAAIIAMLFICKRRRKTKQHSKKPEKQELMNDENNTVQPSHQESSQKVEEIYHKPDHKYYELEEMNHKNEKILYQVNNDNEQGLNKGTSLKIAQPYEDKVSTGNPADNSDIYSLPIDNNSRLERKEPMNTNKAIYQPVEESNYYSSAITELTKEQPIQEYAQVQKNKHENTGSNDIYSGPNDNNQIDEPNYYSTAITEPIGMESMQEYAEVKKHQPKYRDSQGIYSSPNDNNETEVSNQPSEEPNYYSTAITEPTNVQHNDECAQVKKNEDEISPYAQAN